MWWWGWWRNHSESCSLRLGQQVSNFLSSVTYKSQLPKGLHTNCPEPYFFKHSFLTHRRGSKGTVLRGRAPQQCSLCLSEIEPPRRLAWSCPSLRLLESWGKPSFLIKLFSGLLFLNSALLCVTHVHLLLGLFTGNLAHTVSTVSAMLNPQDFLFFFVCIYLLFFPLPYVRVPLFPVSV